MCVMECLGWCGKWKHFTTLSVTTLHRSLNRGYMGLGSSHGFSLKFTATGRTGGRPYCLDNANIHHSALYTTTLNFGRGSQNTSHTLLALYGVVSRGCVPLPGCVEVRCRIGGDGWGGRW